MCSFAIELFIFAYELTLEVISQCLKEIILKDF